MQQNVNINPQFLNLNKNNLTMAKDDELNDNITQVEIKVISENGDKVSHKESDERIFKVGENVNEATHSDNSVSELSFISININTLKEKNKNENTKVQVNYLST